MDPAVLIADLGLQPHPEGGHYRRSWTGPPGPTGRPSGSAIHYLLVAGERSHWHRVDASELWVFNGGDPLMLSVVAADGQLTEHVLGDDLATTPPTQAVVPPGAWQSAVPRGSWTLVTCVVVPGFDPDGFELAPPGWSPV